ncbi:hypothetical protein IJS77_03135 [bacterium]|nr:hypothetical protein [bacterium]
MKLFKNLIKLTILTLAVIGFMSIGGMDLLKKTFSNLGWFNKSQETLMDKANKIADFSNINKEEFEISKTANIMGYKAVVAEHNASGQKFIVFNSGKEPLLTKKDIESDNIDEKIQNINKKIKKQFINFDNVKVVKKSSMQTMEQTVPYVKIEAEPQNMYGVKKVTGIIGAVGEGEDAKVLLAFNTDNKYSQIITDQFFKDVKNAKSK